jgi:hypothetical protein
MIICGVDAASIHLDARIGPDGPHRRVARTTTGIAELAAFCHAQGVDLVVLEASGCPSGCCGPQACPVRSPIRAPCAALPKRWDISRRPTASMPA